MSDDPTPRTEAGRRFHAAKHPRKFHSKQFDRSCGLIQDILAIETEAVGAAPLDVQTMRLAYEAAHQSEVGMCDCMMGWNDILAEYARLAERTDR